MQRKIQKFFKLMNSVKITSVHFPTESIGHNNTDLHIEYVVKEKKKSNNNKKAKNNNCEKL